jgi:3'-5' exonuclease
MSSNPLQIQACFIDIETMPQYEDFSDAPEWMRKYFMKKYQREVEPTSNMIDTMTRNPWQSVWENNAAFSAEFGKIVCISIGKIAFVENNMEHPRFYVKAFCDTDENALLKTFVGSLQKVLQFVAHNGKEFDFPFLHRRMAVNRITVPWILQPIQLKGIGMVKSWDMQLEDTMEMWSGVQWKHKTSLDALCQLFGLPSPKSDMDGSMVAQTVWDGIKNNATEEALRKVATYCNGDLVALANVYCRLKQIDVVIKPEHVIYA